MPSTKPRGEYYKQWYAANTEIVKARAARARIRYTQDPEGERLSASLRFWKKVDQSNQDGCWPWTAYVAGNGYGRFQLSGHSMMAHRVAYEMEKGTIPDGMTIDHLCRNRACCNPRHLEVVTSGENVLRGESPSAKNRAKTHCPQGHEYTLENTRVEWRKDGRRKGRKCRACARDYWRKRFGSKQLW